MSAELSTLARRDRVVAGVVGVGVFAVIAVAGLAWAKWLPYLDKAELLAGERSWAGSPIFDAARDSGSVWDGAWRFAVDYFDAVWRALLVALLVAAALDALVPRSWLSAVLSRRTRWGQSVVGGMLSLPSMMCTCCTAPVAVGLRRRGTPLAASIAYWIGNPLLNPAVIVFLLLVLPWPYALVRAAVGIVLVVGVGPLVARLVGRDRPGAGVVDAIPAGAPAVTVPELSRIPGDFLRSLLRLSVVLVPEYAGVVLALGLVSVPLSDFDGLEQRLGLAAVLLVSVVATGLVVPTGGEIPVIAALTAAGAGTGLAGVLLIALPALSLPSMMMVGRALGWRATAATAGLVVLGSLLAGGLTVALTS